MRYLVRGRRGHQLAQDLWAAADQLVSASITYVETRAALAAGRRGRYWTASQLARLERAWEIAWRDVTVVAVDPLIALAAELAGREGLRRPTLQPERAIGLARQRAGAVLAADPNKALALRLRAEIPEHAGT